MAAEPVDPSLLGETAFFQLLDEQERQTLAALMTKASVTAGERLFNFGDPGDRAYLVSSGQVEIFGTDPTGQKVVYTVAEAGDLFGEISLLDHGSRTASAEVIADGTLLVLDRDTLLKFLRMKPDAALDLLAVLGKRLRLADALVTGRVARNANTEIQQHLPLYLRIASMIADFSGSITFLVLNLVFFTVWIVINVGLVSSIEPFDPYPFGFLTMSVSLEAIVLSIIVLLSQNLQAARDRIRGDVEYEINVQAELEISALHEKMDHLKEELWRRLERLERNR